MKIGVLKKEDHIEDIIEVLHDVQIKLKVPKNQRNTFGNYNYRSCEDIVEAVKLLLPKGYALILKDELLQIGDRYYIKAEAMLHNITGSVTTCGFAREAESRKGMDESQITGATSSYARKYALNGLFGIDDTKDADFDDSKKRKAPPPAKKIDPADKSTNDSTTIPPGSKPGELVEKKTIECPECGKTASVFTDKKDDSKLYCWKKKGGCGHTWGAGDKTIDPALKSNDKPQTKSAFQAIKEAMETTKNVAHLANWWKKHTPELKALSNDDYSKLTVIKNGMKEKFKAANKEPSNYPFGYDGKEKDDIPPQPVPGEQEMTDKDKLIAKIEEIIDSADPKWVVAKKKEAEIESWYHYKSEASEDQLEHFYAILIQKP